MSNPNTFTPAPSRSNAAREIAMYGMTRNELIEQVDGCLNIKILGKQRGTVMEAMSWLSDAQETMAHGNPEQARQFINCVKFMLDGHMDSLPAKQAN